MRDGGLLIYAAEDGDPELDRAFGVVRLGGYISSVNETGNPTVDGVTSLTGAGKTVAAAYPLMQHQQSGLFIYPTNALIEDQARSNFRGYLNRH